MYIGPMSICIMLNNVQISCFCISISFRKIRFPIEKSSLIKIQVLVFDKIGKTLK